LTMRQRESDRARRRNRAVNHLSPLYKHDAPFAAWDALQHCIIAALHHCATRKTVRSVLFFRSS
ncbi:MAG: hypothetical protein KJN99_13030, partial [Marinicaulis sp.]|nr:hypothetical protein [Marinicaulis sp.]